LVGYSLPITAEEFATHYPNLYHMAEAEAWPSIKNLGLLSTTALLDRFEIDGDLRRRIESEHRPQSIRITHPKHGSALIRDQKPMRESALRTCLRGMSPREWYLMLNGQVFFWVTADRVQTLLNARAYRNQKHMVITVETASFMESYALRMRLSPINSGSTIYKPQRRGRQTFRSLTDYPFAERRALRGIQNAIAEIAVDYSVPDLSKFVSRVELRKGSRVLQVLYRSSDQTPCTPLTRII
jgi:Family of unknown function (DUF7002)